MPPLAGRETCAGEKKGTDATFGRRHDRRGWLVQRRRVEGWDGGLRLERREGRGEVPGAERKLRGEGEKKDPIRREELSW